MARDENIEFLKSICPQSLKDSTYEELLDWLFGRDSRTIAVCADKSYRDIQRNLTGIGKMPEKEKQVFRSAISTLIAGCIKNVFNHKITEPEAFDVWHNETCESISEVSREYGISKWVAWMENGFTYGISQKRLNMTIKNMIVMERWDDHLEPIRKYLHVPVDSLIMKKASKEFDINIPCKNGGVGKYSNTGSKPWSRWEFEDYIGFQKDVRKATRICPIDWEFTSWNVIRGSR